MAGYGGCHYNGTANRGISEMANGRQGQKEIEGWD